MDSTNQASAKEKQSASSNPMLVLTPKRMEHLWFDDGSIVLQAETTQFRVHRSVLSTNSEIFRDMFAVPQPTVGDEVIEGCSIVHLSDSAEDWTYVLNALYDSRRCYVNSGAQPFAVVAAFLRLGSKYEIPQLRSEAVKRLSIEYPSKLDKWDAMILTPWGEIQSHRGIHFSVINLAQEVGLTSILPAAFYSACEINGFGQILEGVCGDDDRLVILSAENQKVCMRGWGSLVHTQHDQTFKWLATADNTLFQACRTREKCNNTRMKVFHNTFRCGPVCYALASWQAGDEAGLCGTCVAVSKKMHDAGRTIIWNYLPLAFDLPGWEELLKE